MDFEEGKFDPKKIKMILYNSFIKILQGDVSSDDPYTELLANAKIGKMPLIEIDFSHKGVKKQRDFLLRADMEFRKHVKEDCLMHCMGELCSRLNYLCEKEDKDIEELSLRKQENVLTRMLSEIKNVESKEFGQR